MPRPAPSQPTVVELQTLRVLWELGPSTARDVHNRMTLAKATHYSTTVKMLLVMLGKELVKRDDSVRPQIYSTAKSQAATQKNMVKEMVQKVYDGSTKSLVMHALSASPTSAEDLAEIRKLLEQLP
jgi:BlaI family penicillinase repressor